MMSIVRSRRISKGGYSPGDQALVAGPVYIREEDLQPIIVGPSAEEIERDFQTRIDSVRHEAFLEGFRQGAVEGQRSVEGNVALLRDYLEQLDTEVDTIWAKVELQIAILAMEIGKKVVGEVVGSHESLVIDLARRGIAMAHEQTKVSLLVNPDDAAMLRSATVEIPTRCCPCPRSRDQRRQRL